MTSSIWWVSWSTWWTNANSAGSAATPNQPRLQTVQLWIGGKFDFYLWLNGYAMFSFLNCFLHEHRLKYQSSRKCLFYEEPRNRADASASFSNCGWIFHLKAASSCCYHVRHVPIIRFVLFTLVITLYRLRYSEHYNDRVAAIWMARRGKFAEKIAAALLSHAWITSRRRMWLFTAPVSFHSLNQNDILHLIFEMTKKYIFLYIYR